MFRNKAVLKQQLELLPKKELVNMLFKLSGKRFNYEYLLVNFLDRENGEQILFEEALDDINCLCQKQYKGRTPQHQQTKLLVACLKRVAEFTVEVRNKKLEADLLLYILGKQFELPAQFFGAKSSGFDYKVGLLLKRLITLVTQKLHPDYFADYEDQINAMLQRLHKSSNRINTIKGLPSYLQR